MKIPTPDMPTSGAGRCHCGRVRYEWRARPRWALHCHCESCRRATSGPVASFFGVKDGDWAWTGDQPAVYESSPGVRWSFCATCGAQMGYDADRFPGEIHFYASSMDRPEDFAPTGHVHAEEALPWLQLSDGLPRRNG